MIKTVSYEPSFSNRFTELRGFQCGILLSGVFDDEECLFLPIEVPPKKQNSDTISSLCVQQVEEKWIGSHCKNIERMIPGGVRISGLCLMCSLSEFNAQQDHIKKILSRIPKEDPLIVELNGTREKEKLVLLVDPQTKKFTCKAIDLDSDHPSFRSVPVKSREMIGLWRAFKTSINLCLETTLPTDRKKEKILKQLQFAVEPYLHALLKDTQLLINGDYRDPEQRVVFEESDSTTPSRPSTGKQNKKASRSSRRKADDSDDKDNNGFETKGDSADADSEKVRRKKYKCLKDVGADKGSWADVELTIFGPQFPRWQRASSSSSLESGTSSDTGFNGGSENADSTGSDFVPINRLVLDGKIPGIAFLPHNTTSQSLLQALRKDLVQSIWARLQLLTEELHITSAELEVPRMVLPQRVLVRLPACPSLPLSDYKFLSETADDVVARLQYFCVPIGVKGSGDAADIAPDRASSVDSRGTIRTSTTSTDSGWDSLGSRPQVIPLRDRIDASCLDTSIERSPEASADDEFSEAELMETANQTTQPAASASSSNTTLILLSSVALVLAVLLSYAVFGSRTW